MDAKSGNGRSGNFGWGVIAGLIAVLGAGGLYFSGVFTGTPEPEQPPQDQSETVSSAESSQTADAATPDGETDDTAQTGEQPAEAAPEQETTQEASAPEPTADADPEPVAEPESAAVSDPDPEPDADPEPLVGEATTDEAAPASVAPPALDQIFLATDGNALLSGEAEPGSQIQVLLNGALHYEFTVDATGQFAEFVAIPFSDDAQGLVLQTTSGGQTVQSDDYLIAALPQPAEDQTANAETAEVTPSEDSDQTAAAEPEAQPEQPAEPETAEALTDEASGDQQVAILRSGEEGVELVQPPAVQSTAPEQIALDTIGYSEAGDVQLTGRVKDGSAVRLYLDNRLVADLAPEDDGNWRGELEGIDPGVYTLRVDEVNTDGTVLSRVETPFKREPVEALQAAEAEVGTGAPQESAPIRSVTVQRGDTLWAISRDRFGDGVLYVKLFEANRDLIRDPDLIYPGQIFTIPE